MAASTSFSLLADRCLPASTHISRSTLIYSPEPSANRARRGQTITWPLEWIRRGSTEPVGRGTSFKLGLCGWVNKKVLLYVAACWCAHLEGKSPRPSKWCGERLHGALTTVMVRAYSDGLLRLCSPRRSTGKAESQWVSSFNEIGGAGDKTSVKDCKGETVWLCCDLYLSHWVISPKSKAS